MKLPCEVAVRSVVPAIRASLAKELTENHGMKQMEAANLLGITQTAVSKYAHQVRGSFLSFEENDEVVDFITNTATSLAHGKLDRTSLALRICDACRLVRRKGIMCELCRRINPRLASGKCDLCSSGGCPI